MGSKRKLKMGLTGGGPGAFIGAVHRKAAWLDGQIEIVAGAFDIDPKKSRQTGAELVLDPSRVYDNYNKMIEGELALPAGERCDFVSITTPNNWHFPMARDFLKAGFHVMCEKPMTMSVAEAEELKKIVHATGKIFGLMHTYTGYPMVKLGRDLIKSGDLGKVRKVVVQYSQDWLSTALEKEGQQQAVWRSDPKQSGGGGALGDIGTHAANLVEYMTGLEITHICADLNTFVKGRILDDDANCLLKLQNDAKGVLHVSQIAVGEENHLAIWIYGEKKSVHWNQENPNYLHVGVLGGSEEIWKRGNGYVADKSEAAARATRIPSGHPEGFFEAFANHYCNFADTIRAQMAGETPSDLILDFPQVEAGLRGMCFIEKVIENDRGSEKWTALIL
ncbi:MAG: gfo/Idh/MocA family oxidoreductase [Calditrichaeota bacterium]|nr:MAG: gfo/Idh/MocA family oxidoreductase [Calditrichota bacterium]